MIKSLLNSFTAFFLLSLLMAGCQKKGVPHEEEEIIDAVIIELPNGLPPFECTGGAPESIATFYVDEIGNSVCRAQIQNLGLTSNSGRATGIIINNQAAYDKYLTCAAAKPVIDFDNYFILAGLYRHSSCVSFKQHEVKLCDDKLIFRIDMLKGLCAGPNNVIFSMVAIKKIYSKREIIIDMQFTN
ncbi:MAG TPA: hypothetical protein PK951_03000 [Chitinophagaceae bacterium]|nr:hypothetical protein [Chitinophagaceae bacterium]HUM65194.1 hypothetical protein [Chitinophagaceae bacterium]